MTFPISKAPWNKGEARWPEATAQTRTNMQKNNAIDELLPHNWKPAIPDTE